MPWSGPPALELESSGTLGANNILSLSEHWAQLDRIKDWHYELEM